MMKFRKLQISCRIRVSIFFVVAAVLMSSPALAQQPAASDLLQKVGPQPAAAPGRWRGLIGEYGVDGNILMVLEKSGQLWALFNRSDLSPLKEGSKDHFTFPASGPHGGQHLDFKRDSKGRAILATTFKRRNIEPESGN